MSAKMQSSMIVNKRLRREEGKTLGKKKSDRVPGNSTPKQSKTGQVSSQETLNQDYSPIQLTQELNNEVAWDWQGTRTKSKSKSKPETSSTPKRSRASLKKRNSNSPLVYKPFKKRIIKDEDISSIDKWKNEFLALDAQMETGMSRNDIKETSEENISDELLFDDDFELEDDDPVIVIEDCPVSPKIIIKSEKSATITKPLPPPDNQEKESLDDLFDNSINEESMLRCSQEIEEKLKIGTLRAEPAKKVKKYGLSCGLAGNNSKPSTSTSSPSSSKFKKYKSDPIDKNTSRNQRSLSMEYADLFADLDDFDIPDDSFDEIALTADLDGLRPPSPKAHTKNTTSNTINQESINYVRNPANKVSARSQDKIPGKYPGQTNDGILSGNAFPISSQTIDGNNKRLFRARNHSDSSFNNGNKLGLTLGSLVSNRSNGKAVGRTVSMRMDMRRTNSLDQKAFIMTEENSNYPINHFDRLKLREDGEKASIDMVPCSQTATMCTPQEIEMKRLQAKMKLEAKKKMSSVQNSIERLYLGISSSNGRNRLPV